MVSWRKSHERENVYTLEIEKKQRWHMQTISIIYPSPAILPEYLSFQHTVTECSLFSRQCAGNYVHSYK